MNEVAQLETQIARFADVVGRLRPSAATRRDGHIASIPLGPEFGEISMGTLVAMANNPAHPMMQQVEVTCGGIPDGKGNRIPCATQDRFQCVAFFSEGTICEACRAKWEEQQANSEKKKKWEALCPASFLDTETAHAGFPKAQYRDLRAWDGTTSLFFKGASGLGKTRLAVLLLKRAMHLGKTIGILWPWDVKTLAQNYDSTFDSYSKVPVLLIDDPFLKVCRESKLVDVLKDLIDRRMLNERVTIFTSQISSSSDMAEAKEYGEASNADIERIDAILRRLKESCQVVLFEKATTAPAKSESQDELAPFG